MRYQIDSSNVKCTHFHLFFFYISTICDTFIFQFKNVTNTRIYIVVFFKNISASFWNILCSSRKSTASWYFNQRSFGWAHCERFSERDFCPVRNNLKARKIRRAGVAKGKGMVQSLFFNPFSTNPTTSYFASALRPVGIVIPHFALRCK